MNTLEKCTKYATCVLFKKKEKKTCHERLPIYWLLEKGIVNPPQWAKLVSWKRLTKCERCWFNMQYPSLETTDNVVCNQWELNIIQKIINERENESMVTLTK